MKTSLLTPLALALLSVAASAQSVTFRGKVEDVSGTTNRFIVDCTNTELTSPFINLNAFIGMQVEITGQWNGSSAQPSVSVGSIDIVPEIFEIGGGAKIGRNSHLGFIGAPGDFAVGFLSTSTAFVPLEGDAVAFIDLNQVAVRRSGTIGGTGILQMNFFIPNDPSLIGLEIYGQGALRTAGGRVVTNPDCKTIDD